MSEKKQMISSFHTHTALCKHAHGFPEEYCRVAEQDGCSALGFSDHCPYPDEDPAQWPTIRMSAAEAPEYVRAVRDAAKKVPFPVYVGFECEWDKRFESWYRDELLGTFGAQYLALGSHWVTKGSEHLYALDIDCAADLHAYIDQTIDGIRSGLYTFIAHPDLFMGGWKEFDDDARACSAALLDAAQECNLPVEINGLGMKRPVNETSRGVRYQYPYDEFWEAVAARGIPVICNSDAHDPQDVVASAALARGYARKFGIVPIESPFGRSEPKKRKDAIQP